MVISIWMSTGKKVAVFKPQRRKASKEGEPQGDRTYAQFLVMPWIPASSTLSR